MEINSKPRIIIWFMSQDVSYIAGALTVLHRQHNGLEILGVTGTQNISINDLPFIPLNEINLNGGGGADVLLVVGAKKIGMAEVTKLAKSINIDADKLLADWIVCIPGFTLEKYRRLQRARLTFLSMTCFGATISKTLGLEYLSPFKNLYLLEEEYMKFIRQPRVYLEEDLVFQRNLYNPVEKVQFPVAKLGDISIYLMHYKTFEEAAFKWNERKQKINWYNLLPVMYTSDPHILEQFDALPYGKKVCFSSVKSSIYSDFYINPEIYKDTFVNVKKDVLHTLEYQKPNPPDLRIELIIHSWFSTGNIFFYDIFDMLLYGKKTPLIEM